MPVFWRQFLALGFLLHMCLELKFLAPKINANMADNNANVDDMAAVLTVTALLTDKR